MTASAKEIQMEWSLPASVPQVMQALTDEQMIRVWTGEQATMNKEPDTTFAWFDGWVFGTIVESSPEQLKLQWQCAEWSEERTSLVQVTLAEGKEETKMKLLHSGLDGGEECERFRNFWNDEVGTPLEDYLMIRFHRNG
jgi:activator of HSP90 ATPase